MFNLSTMVSRTSNESDVDDGVPPRKMTITAYLDGDGLMGISNCMFLIVLNGMIILEQKWENGITLEVEEIDINLNDQKTANIMIDTPLVLLMRAIEPKPAKSPDPFTNIDNRAGGNVDLLPLFIGEEVIYTRIKLVNIATGLNTGCYVEICINTDSGMDPRVPVLITVNAASLPQPSKEGTVYVAAVDFNNKTIYYGASSHVASVKHIIWESISVLGFAAVSNYEIQYHEVYVPPELVTFNFYNNMEYWRVCKRFLINKDELLEVLEKPWFIDIAGIPRAGKMDVRGHYMGFIDAGVLLEADENSVSVCVKLYHFNELEEGVKPLINVPAPSAKAMKESGEVLNGEGHESYIIVNIDVIDTLVPNEKKMSLFNYIGVENDEEHSVPTEVLHVTPPPEDLTVDVSKIRRKEGALGVHSELSGLVCSGNSIMDKSIKKTAVTKLLNRVKGLIKEFLPDEESNEIERQEIVTAQHSVARRAVAASFAPQAPTIKIPSNLDAARSLLAGDERLSKITTEVSLKLAPHHPKSHLVKALRCLEKFENLAAIEHLYNGIRAQPQNKYLLWALGAQEFNRSVFGLSKAFALFEFAVKPSDEDGISPSIGWAALHALYHHTNRPYLAFIAFKHLRNKYNQPRDWVGFLDRWTNISGQEEYLWMPHAVEFENPFIFASAFFLCLRGYQFIEILINCYKNDCFYRGVKLVEEKRESPDINYLLGASYLMQGYIDKAICEIETGIKKFGPSAKFHQIKATCLLRANGWDDICAYDFIKCEESGGEIAPALLLRAAIGGVKTDPKTALQRAARAHKVAPCAHSALVIARIYDHLKDDTMSQRWAIAAVDNEPNLADGWAFLACLAIRKRRIDEARSLIRTARQVGPISEDIKLELDNLMDIMNVERLPELLMKDVCYCDIFK